MLTVIYETFIRPASQRLGTLLGTYLTAQGVAQDDITVLATALPVALGVLFDLVIRRLY
jgi:hypothetical protein